MLNKNILAYIAKNPTAKAKDVAKACGVKTHTVYNARYNAKKNNQLPLTALAFEVKKAKAVISNAEIRDRLATLPTVRTHPVTGKLLMQGGADIVTKHHTDMVNEPPHYKTGGIETIDFIEAKKLDYNLGNAVKYITRADHKGDRHEDLCKARWYLNRAIASVSNNA
jgi:tRNA A37 threonylcarbamoyladenosine modification protein TsaB